MRPTRKPTLQEIRQAEELKKLMASSGLDENTCSTLLNPDDEHYVVDIIRKHLRTPEQKVWLDSADLSIEDLLNGRAPMVYLNEVNEIFQSWNAKLGKKMFGYGRDLSA